MVRYEREGESDCGGLQATETTLILTHSNIGNLEGLSAEGTHDLTSVLSGSLWLSMKTRDETTAPVQAVDGEGRHGDAEKRG